MESKPTTQTQSRSRSASTEEVGVRVVKAVAAAEGVDPMTLDPPLNAVVDAAALDQLFRPSGEPAASTVRVTFRYRGHDVTVEADGRVTVD